MSIRSRSWLRFRFRRLAAFLFVPSLLTVLVPLPVSVFMEHASAFEATQPQSTETPSAAPSAFDPSKRYLIIHSDDAGMSHSVNSGTIEGMTTGFVSSCSIMVPGPWFPEFAEFARQNPEKDYGIHLKLNSEFEKYRWAPVAGRDKVPSLCDEQGYLHRGKEAVQKNAVPSEVETELRAQIDRALQFGIRLSHLDTHMGTVISTADMLDIYVRLGLEYDLPVMIIRNLNPEISRAYPDLARKNAEYIQSLGSRGLPAIDTLFQFYDGKDHASRQKRYLDTFRNLKPGVTQMIIHCGRDDEELQNITSSHFLRGDDTRIFSDPEVLKEIQAMGVEIISWKQLKEMRFPSSGPAVPGK
ncbi:MAG: polysaccharide deacetylase family protein [Planctomyces sp.]